MDESGPGMVAARWFALTLGVLSVLGGAGLVLGYVWWALIDRLGEADQSLIFWYLPMLLVGILVLVVGLVAADWGRRGLRRR